jgi:alpha-L-arabinofuranosidase
VAPRLYGLFIEEINRAGDGGLLAERVRNRRFQDSEVPARCRVEDGQLVSPAGWKSPFPEAPGSAPGWSVEGSPGARVEVRTGGGALLTAPGPVTLVNSGFWGMALTAGVACRLRVIADRLPVTAHLRRPDGTVLASAPVTLGPRGGEADLVPRAGEPAAALALVFAAGPPVRMDFVSLVPADTWKGRPDGLRADLVRTLADLNPRFLRFPGGCFVEGFSVETASRWKQTLGPVEGREGQWTLWHYRTTNGLGYHDYLQLAEDLGMTPLFVVNCGLTCQGRPGELVPLDDLGPWVEDMLDAVEYANGPVDSPWGRRRAEAGHPEPFGLEWVEIGNENFGPPYWERYRIFHRALKDRYPEIQAIFNVHWEEGSDTRGLAADLVDEHFYADGEYFRLYHDLYDGYDRRGPKVYLGEYAQTVGNSEGTLAGALNEAAFLTGVERNQDLVTLTSYAPLLAHVNHAVWNPDLVYFDGSSVWRTASFWVQQLFGAHRGQSVVPVTVEAPAEALDARGGAGIEGRFLPLVGRIEALPPGPGEAPDPVPGPDGVVRRGDPGSPVSRVTVTFRPGDRGFRLRVLDRAQLWDRQNYFQWELEGNESRLVHIGGWSRAQPGPTVPLAGPLEAGRDYLAEVETDHGRIVCRLDGRVVHDHTIPAIPRLFACAALDGNEAVVKVVNPGPDPAEVTLPGAWSDGASGLLLTGPGPGAANRPGQPPQVAPEPLDAGAFQPLPGGLGLVLPPWSLAVLRLPRAGRQGTTGQ